MLYTLNLAMCFAFLANVYGEFMQVLNARWHNICVICHTYEMYHYYIGSWCLNSNIWAVGPGFRSPWWLPQNGRVQRMWAYFKVSVIITSNVCFSSNMLWESQLLLPVSTWWTSSQGTLNSCTSKYASHDVGHIICGDMLFLILWCTILTSGCEFWGPSRPGRCFGWTFWWRQIHCCEVDWTFLWIVKWKSLHWY